MGFIYSGYPWDNYRDCFTDELICSLMFPEEFRRRLSGSVYIWNKWEGRRMTEPNIVREPYLIEWSELTEFINWHNEAYGTVFDGDVIFLFEGRDMITVLHHEGWFSHLYPGKSPFAAVGSVAKWVAL